LYFFQQQNLQICLNDIISFPINTSSEFAKQKLGCDTGDCYGKIGLGKTGQAGVTFGYNYFRFALGIWVCRFNHTVQ